MGSHGLFRSTALKSCGVVVGAFALTIPALPASASPGPAPSFQSAVNYPLDYEVHTVVSGDVNGDDIKDLVSLNQVDPGDPPISVQLGTGTGTFGSAHAYGTTLTGVASDIALADLDGNHHLDVVISEPEFIATIPGNGDGTFASTTEVGSTGVNTAIAIGDFDGVDGPDVVVAHHTFAGFSLVPSLELLLNDGSGGLAAPIEFTSGVGSKPTSIAVADLNADGDLDVVLGDGLAIAQVSVLLGDGSGSFGTGAQYATTDIVLDVTVGDVDKDGNPDIVGVSSQNGDLGFTLPGAGDGSFRAAIDSNLDVAPSANAVSDINGDGLLDLVTTNNGSIGVSLGDGTGAFGSETTFAAVSDNYGQAVADFNGDGKPDVATGNRIDKSVSVFINDTPTPPPPATPVTVSLGSVPPHLVVGQVINANVKVSPQQRKSGKSRSITSINGTATVTLKGKKACTATIHNGRGSCKVTIKKRGPQTLKSTFSGTVGGDPVGKVTAGSLKLGNVKTVSVTRGKLFTRGCSINARLSGLESKAGRKVTVLQRFGGKWRAVASTTATAKNTWGVQFATRRDRGTFKARDAITTTVPVSLQVASSIPRAC